MPSVGFKVFDVREDAGYQAPGSLRVTASSLENARYRVDIDANGDIASIFDKDIKRELLKSPIRLEMRDNPSPGQTSLAHSVRDSHRAGARVSRQARRPHCRTRSGSRRTGSLATGWRVDHHTAHHTDRPAAIAWTSRTSSTGSRRTPC
jgi:hypothetical protein